MVVRHKQFPKGLINFLYFVNSLQKMNEKFTLNWLASIPLFSMASWIGVPLAFGKT
jgi:hypothetical protein